MNSMTLVHSPKSTLQKDTIEKILSDKNEECIDLEKNDNKKPQ